MKVTASSRATPGAIGILAAICLSVGTMLLSSCEEPVVDYIGDEYLSWERTTEADITMAITGHPPGARRIFINEIGTNVEVSEQNGQTRWVYPVGTIIVKENYAVAEPGEDDEPMVRFAMVKAPEEERSRGGWLWVREDYAGGEEVVFDNEFCIACHSDANEEQTLAGAGNANGAFRDFVFYPYQGQ